MKARVNCIAVGFLSLCFLANNAMATEMEELRPSDMDLIEFLGGWESDDGAWLDPALFDDVFVEDPAAIEGESVLRTQDLKPSKMQGKGDALLEGETKDSVSGMRKEEK